MCFSAFDLGVYDPDSTNAQVTYGIETLPAAAQGKLQTEISGVWTDAASATLFTLADLVAGKVRFVHSGATPAEITFTYKFKDNVGNFSAAQEVTINVRETNDAPSDPELGISRIDPEALAGTTVATLSTTDEETTTQTAFTYALVSGEGDNAYFTITGRELSFKSSAALTTAGLKLKLEGDNYIITLTVTDTGVGSDADQVAITKTVTYTIPVRSFLIDWADAAGVQDAPTTAVDMADTRSGDITIGTFRIDPELDSGVFTGTYQAFAPAAGNANDYGIVKVVSAGNSGVNVQKFNVTFAVNENSELLKALKDGETESVTFFIEVRYIPDGDTEADGFRRSLVSFTIDFTGDNEPPEAIDPDLVVFEATAGKATAEGKWAFTDPDTGAAIAATGLLAVAGASNTPTATNLVVNTANANYDATASFDVAGSYGTLTILAGGTWSYARDLAKIDPVSLAGGTDVFLLNVTDEVGAVGATPLRITIMIEGENDAPTLQANNVAATDIDATDRSTSTADLTAAVTETASSGTTHASLTQGAGQKASGQWLANDVDIGAKMRLFSGAFEIGEISSSPLVFEGRYGTITFKTDGTWEYVLNARAEKIADGQTPVEVFDLKVVDEYGAESNEITLTITVTGDNDAPTALVEGDPTTSNSATPITDKGTVVESGFRTDAGTATIRTGSLTTPALTLQTADTTLEARVDVSGGTADVLGTPAIRGKLDAVDIDRVDSEGRNDAIDEHTFKIWGGAGATARSADVDAVSSTDDEFDGTYGTLQLDADGTWVYTLNNQLAAVYNLNVGDTGTETFTIRIADAFGGAVSDTLVITITGTADAPILSVDTSGGASSNDLAAGEAGGTANGTAAVAGNAAGVFTFTDDDANDTTDGFGTAVQLQGIFGDVSSTNVWTDGSNTANSNKGTKYAGAYGDFYLKNDGSWSYEVDQAKTATQELDDGDSVTDSFDVRIDNTRGSTTIYSNVITVEVSIAGANDAPTLSVATTEGVVREGGDGVDPVVTADTTANGTITFADVDDDDTLLTLDVFVGTANNAANTTTTLAVGGTATTDR